MGLFSSIFSAILGGIANSSNSKEDRKKTEAEIKLTGTEDRKTASLAAELAYYYKKLDDVEKTKGAGNYAQFNSLERFAPNYTPTYTPNTTPPPKPVVS